MKNLIILILISLSIFAQDNQNFKKPSKEALEAYQRKLKEKTNKDNPYMWDFHQEVSKKWQEISKNVEMKEKKLTIDVELSKQQAQIDIVKAEMQKIFLKYIEEGKFKENDKFKMPLTKIDETKPEKIEIQKQENKKKQEKIQIKMK